MRLKKELAVYMANLMLLQNLRQKVGTYAQRETKLWNRVTDINALEIRKLILEDKKVANRKLCIRRIVQKANACGNSQDILTWTR